MKTPLALGIALFVASGSVFAQDAAPAAAPAHHPHESGRESTSHADAAVREANDHVAPAAPQSVMHDMSPTQMIETMQMDDRATWSSLRIDRFEQGVDESVGAWRLQASHGGDVDRVLLRSEGELDHGHVDTADAELLWSRAIAPFWDGVLGLRRDFGDGSHRNWLALGVQGIAPYGLDIEATGYVGDGQRSALRVEVAYDLRLTQRLLLQPRIEANAYGRSDKVARIGSGLSDAEAGLRLRYQLHRGFAPYLGVERRRLFGASAAMVQAQGKVTAETRWFVGVQMGL